MGFSGGASGKEPACTAGDMRDQGSIPGSGRPPREGNGSPCQHSCQENPMHRGAWWPRCTEARLKGLRAVVHTGFPRGSATKQPPQGRRPGLDPRSGQEGPRRRWQPTPVFLPGESHGQRSLVGYSPWRHERVGQDWVTKFTLGAHGACSASSGACPGNQVRHQGLNQAENYLQGRRISIP